MSDDWLTDDPFADPDDPAAREREQRRREREEKRRQREEKEREREEKRAAKEKEAAPPPPKEQPVPKAEPVPPPPPPKEEPPAAPRTPEQEFWDEDPEPEPEPAAAPVATAYHDEGDPEMAGAARNGRRVGDGGVRRRDGFLGSLARHPFRIFAVLVALFLLWSLNQLFQPFHGDGSGHVAVTIPKGSSVSEVGDLLTDKGVIDDSTLFQIRVTLAGKRSEIYSGHFTLAHNMSYGAAIDALSTPPVKRTLSVTIPEGYTRSQAAQLVEEDGVPGSYTKATVKSKYLNPAQYGGKGAKDLEGFLFPDTFELKPNAPVADLVQLQLQDFKRRIKGVDMKYAKSKNLTVYDVLIIASMVEREAGVSSQYDDVASVIYNRLHEGMPLGIDATIRFATGNYTKPLTESELAIDSPYNSRTNVGLPPGPINSPGLKAIEAAAHPAKNGYLFYVTTPGACGKLTFAKTEAEFEAAVDKYNSAREAAGGNSPDSCGE
ncbi:MAG TPA: endolytic transglycosylase MltG [Solirubrobacterales bacterium]|nr:endolytic transglycosylase MltG [Solirubrobacterales bacterium]